MTNSRGGCFGFTLVASALFLASPACAQDGKDREIERLKAKLAVQEKLAERLAQEIESLRKTVAEREKSIASLEAKVKEYKQVAVTFEAMAKIQQKRLEALLEELRSGPLLLQPKLDPKRDEPNPPAEKIEGKITKVSGKLVELNLGTDNGLKENHTLELYRLEPTPKYIGRIRITDARHKNSVGRIIGNGKETPKEGDKVTSELK